MSVIAQEMAGLLVVAAVMAIALVLAMREHARTEALWLSAIDHRKQTEDTLRLAERCERRAEILASCADRKEVEAGEKMAAATKKMARTEALWEEVKRIERLLSDQQKPKTKKEGRA